MKASKETLHELERLFSEYQKEVHLNKQNGYVTPTTAKTYLLHSGNFVKWCNGDFVPGGRNSGNL